MKKANTRRVGTRLFDVDILWHVRRVHVWHSNTCAQQIFLGQNVSARERVVSGLVEFGIKATASNTENMNKKYAGQ